MSGTIRRFIDPKTDKPVDKDWLDCMIGLFVTTKTEGEILSNYDLGPRTEREIYRRFAQPQGASSFYYTRPSWQKKSRKVKRDMIAGSIRRLIFVGQIRIVKTDHPNCKSMHGIVRRDAKSDQHLFGQGHDGVIRSYGPSTLLDALVEAMGDME